MRLTDFDWPEIILDLRRSGMGQHEIARSMGHAVGESMVRHYLAGASPSHWRGELLLELWEHRTGRERQDAPRRPAEVRRLAERRPRQKAIPIMPMDHLQAVAQGYGLSVQTVVDLLSKRPVKQRSAPENLSLPGFDT